MENQRASEVSYENSPLVLIFSDSREGARAAANSVVAAGGRIGASVSIEEAAGRLASQAVAETIIIDITRDHDDRIHRLLDIVEDWGDGQPVQAIVSLPLAMVDHVAGRMLDDRVTLLCDADPADWITALTARSTRRPAILSDFSAELDSVRMRRMVEEVGRLSRSLSKLVAGNVAAVDASGQLSNSFKGVRLDFLAEPMAAHAGPAIDAAEVRALLRLRRLRGSYFSSDLFADPAWDMLLDLTAAQLEGEQVAVSSLCIAAAVPPTTALRWIKTMADHGLFERQADPLDGRRIFIQLSQTAMAAMLRYLAAAKQAGGLVV